MLALWLALCLLAVPAQPAAVRRRLGIAQSGPATLRGLLFAYELDYGGSIGDASFFVLHLSDGGRVRLDPAPELQQKLEGLPPGTDVAINGQWVPGGGGGSSSGSGTPGRLGRRGTGGAAVQSQSQQSQQQQQQGGPAQGLRFRGSHVVAVSQQAQRAGPRLTRVSAGPAAGAGVAAAAAGGAGAAGTARAAAGVLLSSNQLVASDLPTLVIPIFAAANGASSAGGTCEGTSPPLYAPWQVRRALFEPFNPQAMTVGATFSRCSGGKTRLTPATSVVTDPVHIPCSGASPYSGVPWSFDSCSFEDFSGLADAVDAVLTARGVNMRRFKHFVYLLPPTAACDSMVGLAHIGCAGLFACRAWIGAKYWTTPQAYVHELSHNLFLAHAGKVVDGTFDEYADDSATMGYCCADRCPNTPHAWQLGWSSLQQLDGASLARGQTVPVPLPSQSLGGPAGTSTGLRVVPSWIPPAAVSDAFAQPVYVGYRTPHKGDAGLHRTLANKVHIYTAAIVDSHDPKITTWEAMLQAGQSWEQPGTGLVLRVLSTTARSATVTVCRRGGRETMASCQAKQDNDCNGLAGPADPACVPLLARRVARAGR